MQDTVRAIEASGQKAAYYTGDVTDPQDCDRIIRSVTEQFGRLDILVNNAGMSMRGLFQDTSLELFRKIVDINLMGAVNMSKCALEQIIRAKGSILFVSSLSGLKGLPGIAPYSTAKMALTGFSDALRCELNQYGVHIGIVYVGFTQNDSGKKVFTGDGQLVDIARKANHATQSDVARSILKCLDKRRDSLVLTCLGRWTKLMVQFLPGLSNKILKKHAVRKYRDI